jgi:formylglycine-generating enzyme required for sulfatase activity
MAALVAAGEYRLLEGPDASNAAGLPVYLHVPTQMEFVRVPATQEFWMGSREGQGSFDERPRHRVSLSPFLIGRYCVWQDLFDRGTSRPLRDLPSEAKLPVVEITWEQARAFCARHGWTLPSEAQWECACRAGSESEYSFGESLDESLANFGGTYGGTTPVDGSSTSKAPRFAPNAFGLFHTHGNVWESCHDVNDYGFYSRPEALNADPLCLSGSANRVLRGGAWGSDAWFCRSAVRYRDDPGDRNGNFGFRPARPLR